MFIFAFVIGMMAMANTIEKKDSQTLPEVNTGVVALQSDGSGSEDVCYQITIVKVEITPEGDVIITYRWKRVPCSM